MYDLVIHDAICHGLPDTESRVLDVAVHAGRIARVEPTIREAAREELDARAEMHLMPGCIDLHVHLRRPGHPEKEDWATGTRAAAIGGITTVLDMPNTRPATTDAETLAQKRELAALEARVHFGLFIGATSRNLDVVRRLEDGGTPPIAVKVFMGSSTGDLLVDDPATLDRWMREVRSRIAVHAEDERVLERAHAAHRDEPGALAHGRRRPREAAVASVALATGLAVRNDHPLHICHMSCAEELAVVRASASTGLVTCEVSPHHLFLDESHLERLGNFGKMNPPLRTAHDRTVLLRALRDRAVDAVATDHAPHTRTEKERPTHEAPSGVPGLDTSLRLMTSAAQAGLLSWDDLAWAMSVGPARAFELRGKGTLAPGADADLVLVRPGARATLTSAQLMTRCGWSPFEGLDLAPPPHRVWVGGQLVAADGRIVDDGVRGVEVNR